MVVVLVELLVHIVQAGVVHWICWSLMKRATTSIGGSVLSLSFKKKKRHCKFSESCIPLPIILIVVPPERGPIFGSMVVTAKISSSYQNVTEV